MADGRPTRIGAFFDVDKTILSENSATLYLKALYRRGEIDWKDLITNLGSYLRYRLNLLDLERWIANAVIHFKGRSVRSMEREWEQLFEGYMQRTIYAEAVELIDHHLKEKHVVALVSGATRLVTQPLAEYLGVEHSVYTQMEVKDGIFTGRVVQPICFGEGKIYWLQQLIEREEVDLARSYFYTDSITDVPLLDLVGHPVVVNPDALLYRQARRRRWPVRYFRAPRSAGTPA
ncbi:MAG: HAD family hydrolase [Myxococcota bacterium]